MSSPDDRFGAWKRTPGPGPLAPLLEAIQGRVFNICFQVLRHRQDAEEAKQEVLLEITSGIQSIADAAHFERWVGKVAFRTALDKRRMRLRRSAHENHAAGRAPNGNGPDDALHEGMSRLDEDDRVLLIERYFDRRTLQEVGDRRGISAVAARKRIDKARERLKKMLGGAVVLLPGDPSAGSLVGNALSKGVIAMKLKTFANAATLIILLSIVGGGAWTVLGPREGDAIRHDPSLATGPVGGGRFLEERSTERRPMAAGAKINSIALPKVEAYPPGHWTRVVHLIDQIAVASRRARELKSESRKAPSEDEGRRMQFEAKLLEDSIQALYKELLDLAPQDPASVVEFVKSDRGHVIRHSLMNMIKASVELEIEGEHSPSGPLLSGLLTLANGSTDDRWTILQFVRSLARANRAVGEAAFSLLADADYELRNEAAAVLSTHARRGNLREFLLENEAALRQAALTNLGVNDYQARGSALIALAALGTPESDDFVLQRFEALEDMRDVHHGIEAILHIAPRIAERHEARIYNSLLRTLEMPFYQICKQEVLELAFFLPREKCLQVLRLAQMKATADDPGTANVAAGFIHAVEAGQQETWRNAVEKQRRERFKGGIPYLLEQRRGARAIISQ